MNDHDLDARAATAATDLRDRAAARPIPAFDPDRPTLRVATSAGTTGSRRRTRVLAVAAAVALLGGGTWVATRDDDRDPGAIDVATSSGDLTGRVAGWLPPGSDLQGVAEVTGDAEDAPGLDLYGPAADDPRLGLAAGPTGRFADEATPGTTLDLGGGRTAVLAPLDVLADGASRVTFTGPDGTEDHEVLIVGRELTDEQVALIVRNVRVESGRAVLDPQVVSEEWRHLGTEPDLASLTSPHVTMSGGPRRLAIYSTSEGIDGRGLTVSVQPGESARLHAARLLLDDVEEVRVGDRPALLGLAPSDPGTTARSLSWSTESNELVRLWATGVSEADLLRVAASLEAVDEETWDHLVEQTQLGDLDDRAGAEIARGRLDDGTPWVLRQSRDEPELTSLSVAYGAVDDGAMWDSTGASSSDPDGRGFPYVEVAHHPNGRHMASGLLAPDVTALELRDGDGAVVDRPEVLEGPDGIRAWVAELAGRSTVVAFDDDGREIARRELDTQGIESPGDGVGPTLDTVPASGDGDSDPGGGRVGGS